MTLTKTSARTANLRAILADDDNVRKTVVEMVNSMASVDKEDVRGFRRAMLLDPTSPEYSLPPHAASFSLNEIQHQLLRNHLQRGLVVATVPSSSNHMMNTAETFTLQEGSKKSFSIHITSHTM